MTEQNVDLDVKPQYKQIKHINVFYFRPLLSQQAESDNHFGKLENDSNEGALYHTIDDASGAVGNQPGIPDRKGLSSAEKQVSAINTNHTATSTTHKDYYLSPVSLKTRTYK